MHERPPMREPKPRILAFVKHYLPGYRMGGPTRTIANMVDRLGDDLDFCLVTSDRDMGTATRYPGITREYWQPVGKARVHYVSPRLASIRYLATLISRTSPDLIYLNSFFDPSFTQKVLIARRLKLVRDTPIVLAPRGEFSPGALRLKASKKTLYIKLAKLLGPYSGLTWHASSEREETDIRRMFGHVSPPPAIVIARNLAPGQESTHHGDDTSLTPRGHALRVCFLSRISPMKNLDFALRVLKTVNSPLTFTIYGPKEDEAYWRTCEAMVADLPENIQVDYRGAVLPEQVRGVLRAHDVFFLPTRGENYGHVIHEALAAGLPVLLSDQTPWGDVVDAGVGWTLPLNDPAAFARVIEDVDGWDSDRLAMTKKMASDFALARAVAPDTLEANLNLFLDTIRSHASTNVSR